MFVDASRNHSRHRHTAAEAVARRTLPHEVPQDESSHDHNEALPQLQAKKLHRSTRSTIRVLILL